MPAAPLDLSLVSDRRRTRCFNPLRSLTAESLALALQAFDGGDLRNIAILWQAMCERDDTLASVKPKREDAIANRRWQITTDDDTPESKKHKEVLEDFWKNATAVNAYDRNDTGGVRLLIRQKMEAVSYKYAAHHIVWRPEGRKKKLRATFEYVPLHFFENHTGTLRFIPDGLMYEGQEIDPAEWSITVGRGVMISACIGYYAKRNAFQDWQVFSSKFAIPGVLGRTNRSADSEEGKAMAAAVESITNDWAGVIYGDDGSQKDPISFLTVNGGTASMPMPPLIDRIDRKLSALYRGADLSSMSAGSGSGEGASLQGEEAETIERGDAAMIQESFHRIEKQVIAWHFGPEAEPLARFEIIIPPGAKDTTQARDNLAAGIKHGVPVAVADAREILSLPTPGEGDELLKPEQPKAEMGKQKSEMGNQQTGTAPASPDAKADPALNALTDAWATRLTEFIIHQSPLSTAAP